MTAVMPLQVPFDGWTVDDLPDDDLFRHSELVDGALLVNPPPSLRHQETAMAMARLILPRLPAEWRVVVEPGVHFDRRNYRQPDVVVYDAAALARDRIEPPDVRLAVEIMSPGSVSTDRVTKPAQYAAAGIPHFWRLELDPLVLVVHRLVGTAYDEVGRFEDEVHLVEPVEVRFRLGSLLD
jgi:Uma2 family endonuclease